MDSSITAILSTVPTYLGKKVIEKTWTFTVEEILDTR